MIGMVELDNIPQQAHESIEPIGKADLAVAILGTSGQAGLGPLLTRVRKSLSAFPTPPRTVVIHGISESDPASVDPDLLQVVQSPLTQATAMGVGENLGVRVCAFISPEFDGLAALIRPVLELGFDVVTPCYDHHKFEGLINSSIVAPLTCALYGRRLQHPLGPDFALSARALERHNNRPVDAIVGGLEICQAHVGPRIYPPTDWTNLSSLLAQVLDPLFLEAERYASFWQRIHRSQTVPEFGERLPIDEQTGAVEVSGLIESFQLGYRNLQDVWRTVLPPATLLELGKIARLAPDQFRMSDQVWARIVYDFVMGFHLRTIHRDHLLRALTPLYLAWVASYALEMEAGGQGAQEQRLEQLAMAYEMGKPYLLSQWRWPDRFNP
jgi:hypothetical protein